MIQAAGGVVWQMRGSELEVLLVHRSRRQDWTFPKGKVEPSDRDDEHAALREVIEETGYQCTIGRELPSIDYSDHRDRPKHVRYWEMPVLDGEFVPNDEVDEIAWLPVSEAAERLTYPHDRDVLAAFATFAGAS